VRNRQVCASGTGKPLEVDVMMPTRLSMLLLLVFALCLVREGSAAWQEIADYTDCGSTNFDTESIIVDFNPESYWLNVSIIGRFTTEVVDSNPTTNKICTPLLQKS
jgi:hypothetical protein